MVNSVFGSLKTAVQVVTAIDQAVEGRSTEMSYVTLKKDRKDRRITVPLTGKQAQTLDDGLDESEATTEDYSTS